MKQALDGRLPAEVDAVVIGSSPLMLCKAIELAEAGQRVIVLERSSVLGGAWYSPALLGFESVEAGVHLIENRARVHRYLESLGVELSAPDHRGVGLWRSHRMTLAMARAISFVGVLAKATVKRDREKVATTLPRMLRSFVSLFVPFRYPTAGAQGMVHALCARLRDYGIEPISSCNIEEVVLAPGRPGGLCRSEAGVVAFKTFHFASRAHCPLRLGDSELVAPLETRETCSVLVRVSRKDVAPFTYVEILADRDLRRVRDVTEFARPRPPESERVLCIQLRESDENRDDPDEEVARRAVERIARYGLVGEATEILRIEIDRFIYQTIPDKALVRLASKHDALCGVKTTDFAEDLVGPLSRRARTRRR